MMRLSRRSLLMAAPGLMLGPARLGAAEDEGRQFLEFTPESEESIRRGTAWLMKTMHRDGGCGVDIGQPADIGCSAMVGLALLSQGNTPVEGPRSYAVRKLVSFMLRAVEDFERVVDVERARVDTGGFMDELNTQSTVEDLVFSVVCSVIIDARNGGVSPANRGGHFSRHSMPAVTS